MIFLTLLLKKNKTKFDFTRQRTNNTVQFFAATNNTEKKKISNETYLYNNQPTSMNHLRNEQQWKDLSRTEKCLYNTETCGE